MRNDFLWASHGFLAPFVERAKAGGRCKVAEIRQPAGNAAALLDAGAGRPIAGEQYNPGFGGEALDVYCVESGAP